ncbi:MAG TPA: HIT family protein [Acidimicrobiales bacterium]|nr:HIT family protein [Acidimicrobiales bacterium]
MAEGCPFCEVIAGAAGAAKVVDEERVVAFLDTSPVFKGHVLVVPRAHHETLVDVPEELLAPLFRTVQRVQRAIVDALGAQGTFVAANNTVSQSVPHLHVHVVPRTKGDGLRGFFWPRVKYDSTDDYEDHAARLRAALPAR